MEGRSANNHIQHLFRLGRDEAKAKIANTKLEQLWECVQKRWELWKRQNQPVYTVPLWCDVSLSIGKTIAAGNTECTLTPPAEIETSFDQVNWLNVRQLEFPIISLRLSNEKAYAEGMERMLKIAGEL